MSSLTVLCITNDPGDQITQLWRELRSVAAEIVIAADSRVAGEDPRFILDPPILSDVGRRMTS